MGKIDAKHDRDRNRSSLPLAILKGNQHQGIRLLASNGDRFYLARMDSSQDFPEIVVVGSDDVEFIKKSTSRK